MSLRLRAISGARWLGISNAATSALQFLQLAVLARLLAPQDFGLMTLAMIVVGFAQVYSDMGMSGAVIHRQDATQAQLSSLYWVNLLSGMLIFTLLQMTIPWLVGLWGKSELAAVVRWCALIFLIEPLGQQFRVLLERDLRFAVLARIEVAASLLAALAAIFFAVRGAGVHALVWGLLTGASIKATCYMIIGSQSFVPSFRLRPAELESYWRFGVYRTLERTVNFVGFNLDKMLLGSLLGTQALGFYTIAYQLMAKPYQAFNPIMTRVAFPILSRMQGDDTRMRSAFLRMVEMVALVMFPLYAMLVALAEPLLLTVLGTDWVPAIDIFRVLALLGFFYSLGNPIGSLLMAKGHTDIGFYLNVLMIALYLPAVWWGAQYGGEGVAWSLVAATACGLFPAGFWVRYRLVGLTPGAYVRAFLPVLCCALAAGYGIHLLDTAWLSDMRPAFRLALLASTGSLIYLAAIYRWKKRAWEDLWAAIR